MYVLPTPKKLFGLSFSYTTRYTSGMQREKGLEQKSTLQDDRKKIKDEQKKNPQSGMEDNKQPLREKVKVTSNLQ